MQWPRLFILSLWFCVQPFDDLAIDDQGKGGDQGDRSEIIPDIVRMGTRRPPSLTRFEQGRFRAVGTEQEAGETEAQD